MTEPEPLQQLDRTYVRFHGRKLFYFSGCDYFRLASTVDAIELYAYGENIPIVRSFNPELILLTTSFGGGPAEAHRVWREPPSSRHPSGP